MIEDHFAEMQDCNEPLVKKCCPCLVNILMRSSCVISFKFPKTTKLSLTLSFFNSKSCSEGLSSSLIMNDRQTMPKKPKYFLKQHFKIDSFARSENLKFKE